MTNTTTGYSGGYSDGAADKARNPKAARRHAGDVLEAANNGASAEQRAYAEGYADAVLGKVS